MLTAARLIFAALFILIGIPSALIFGRSVFNNDELRNILLGHSFPEMISSVTLVQLLSLVVLAAILILINELLAEIKQIRKIAECQAILLEKRHSATPPVIPQRRIS